MLAKADLALTVRMNSEGFIRQIPRVGYGRNFDVGVFGSIFGHTATQNLPVLVAQQINPASNTESVFSLSEGPPAVDFPTVPSSGELALPDQVSAFALPRKIRLPTVDAWNVTVQHEISPTLSLAVGYVANKGTHVFAGDGPIYDPNQATIVGFGSLDTNERKPFFKKFGWTQQIQYLASDASDNYNSLQVVADKRFARGYQFLAHYTWSKSLGYDSDYYAIDPRLNYGVSNTDRKHVFVLTNLVELPVGKGKALLGNGGGITNRIVGGWSLSGTITWESGLLFLPPIRTAASTGTPVPAAPILLGPFASPGVGTATSPPPGACHWSSTAHPEVLSDRGSDRPSGPLEVPQEIPCAGLAFFKATCPLPRASHCRRVSRCNFAPTSSTFSTRLISTIRSPAWIVKSAE
jgi:hypothetical protein